MDEKTHTVNFEFPDGVVVTIDNITTERMVNTIEEGLVIKGDE